MTEYIKNTGLPAEIEQQIEQDLLSDKAFLKLRDKYSRATMQQRFADAARLHGDIRNFARRFAQSELDRLGHETSEVMSLRTRMTSDDALNFNIATDTIALIADMLEYSIMDLNAILHKYEPESDILTFDRMNRLLSEVKARMAYMADRASPCYQEMFADTADDIQSLVRNKVSKFVRKRQELLAKEKSE